MTKLKMGMHNRITPERFELIRSAIAGGMSDQEIMRRYEIKRTTLQYIAKSKTFYEYRLYTETLPAARKMPKVIMPSSGLALEDYESKKYRAKIQDKAADRQSESLVESLGLGLLVIAGFIMVFAAGILILRLSLWL